MNKGCKCKNNFLNLFRKIPLLNTSARLAQSVEHETLNLRVVGSSHTLGDHFFVSSNFRIHFSSFDFAIGFIDYIISMTVIE